MEYPSMDVGSGNTANEHLHTISLVGYYQGISIEIPLIKSEVYIDASFKGK